MTKLPICICLFTSTKGHFGFDTYLDTLKHLDHQVPLSSFAGLYAHIKVSPDAVDKGDVMTEELTRRGFTVEKTFGNWNRGMSHQNEYLLDMRKASRSHLIQGQPYMLLLEDDSLMVTSKDLLDTLASMITFLEDPEVTSTRFIRESDYQGGVPVLSNKGDFFFSPNFDFQPAVLRSRDFFVAHRIVEENWSQASQMQCEMVMRMALDKLARTQFNHIVWTPPYAHTPHIGVKDYPAIKGQYGL